jgi:hypothetical protein
MKTISLLMGSATLAIGGALSASTPSLAQYAGNPPQVSTPAEQAETMQLNQRAANGTYRSPDELNGEGSQAAGAAPMQQAQYQDQQQLYQQQQQQYEQQQGQYEAQQGQYRAQRHQYIRDLRRYDLARYEFADYPRVYVYRYRDARLRPVYLIADPSHQLAQVPVEGPSGRFVGKVRNIETAPDGRPLRVEVSLNRIVSVWVSPGHFRYDPYNRVLFTDLTRDDLWNMPGATVESDIYMP